MVKVIVYILVTMVTRLETTISIALALGFCISGGIAVSTTTKLVLFKIKCLSNFYNY